MNTASLELCTELYERSGWRYDAGKNGWWYTNSRPDGELDTLALATSVSNSVPAYDLGYLLRKLPPYVDSKEYPGKPAYLDMGLRDNGPPWFVWYVALSEIDVISDFGVCAETPEDAAAKLCIELFKQGVLTSE
jgi:hypothetical protein